MNTENQTAVSRLSDHAQQTYANKEWLRTKLRDGLTHDEIALEGSTNKSTIDRWVKHHKLHAVRTRGHKNFKMRHVIGAWLAKHPDTLTCLPQKDMELVLRFYGTGVPGTLLSLTSIAMESHRTRQGPSQIIRRSLICIRDYALRNALHYIPWEILNSHIPFSGLAHRHYRETFGRWMAHHPESLQCLSSEDRAIMIMYYGDGKSIPLSLATIGAEKDMCIMTVARITQSSLFRIAKEGELFNASVPSDIRAIQDIVLFRIWLTEKSDIMPPLEPEWHIVQNYINTFDPFSDNATYDIARAHKIEYDEAREKIDQYFSLLAQRAQHYGITDIPSLLSKYPVHVESP